MTTLLETTAAAMDATFNLKDVVYICSFVGSGVLAWSKMQRDKDRLAAKIEAINEKEKNDFKDLKERIAGISASKKAMKVEIMESIEKKDLILHTRIDRVRKENIKSYEKLEDKLIALDKKYDLGTAQILAAIREK